MPYPPRAGTDNPYGPQVQFRTEDVLPPTALYLSMDDTLLVQTICAASQVFATATVRMLLPDGTLRVDYYQVVPSPINVIFSYVVIPPVEGYLLSAIVQVDSTLEGSCWCQMTAFKGSVAQPIITLPPVSGLLVVQGYVDQSTFLAWPNSPAVEAGVGAGRIRYIAPFVANGTNWICKTTSVQRWQILAVQARLTTSAAATPRQVSLAWYDHFGNSLLRIPCNFTQGPSLAYSYYFYVGAAHIETSTTWITAPLPAGLILDPVMSLQSAVAFLDPGDSWSFVDVAVQEWMGVSRN